MHLAYEMYEVWMETKKEKLSQKDDGEAAKSCTWLKRGE
jgi:hypothetical protein